jgi:hypothetical protein
MGNTGTTEQVPILDNNVNTPNKNDKITMTSYSLDSVTKYETTITSIKESHNRGQFEINCNPSYHLAFLLYKNDHNFINIYNKIKVGDTYTLVCKNDWFLGVFRSNIEIIVDILPPDTHTLTGPIKGFLNITDELAIYDYHEIITDDTHNKMRLLISDKNINDIVVGHTYKISYVRGWRSNLYKVTDYELI